MRLPVTTGRMVAALARLNAVFGKYDEDELTKVAASYAEVLSDLDAEQVDGAATLALKLEGRFPYPSKLREHALEWTKRNRVQLSAPKAAGDERVCPYCDAKPRLALLATTTAAGEEKTISRYICPCHPEQHPPRSAVVPMPANFVGWDDTDPQLR